MDVAPRIYRLREVFRLQFEALAADALRFPRVFVQQAPPAHPPRATTVTFFEALREAIMTQSSWRTRRSSLQAVCSPSRNSFMSGRRPDTTRVWNFQTR